MKRKISVKRRLNFFHTAIQDVKDLKNSDKNLSDFEQKSRKNSSNTRNSPSATANLLVSEQEMDFSKIFGEKSSSPVSVMSLSSMNSNGMISLAQINHQPNNLSEWLLNLVLQRANLLQYFDIFISQGGDDVQQLLEAGEEEFLEIMALVGMASKPLHVRRLQKALQEYSTNPLAFQAMAFQKSGLSPPPGMALAAAQLPTLFGAPFSPQASVAPTTTTTVQFPAVTSTPAAGLVSSSTLVATVASAGSPGIVVRSGTSPNGCNGTQNGQNETCDKVMTESKVHQQQPTAAPFLTLEQISRLAECAQNFVAGMPDYDLKPLVAKNSNNGALKNTNRASSATPTMDSFNSVCTDPSRLDYCRRYAKIVGHNSVKKRFGAKYLSAFELCLNEAAAQICLLKPELLNKREELTHISRQVVKDAGLWHLKTTAGGLRNSPPESVQSDFEGSPAPSTSTCSEMSPEGLIFGDFDRRRSSLSLPVGTLPNKRRCLAEIGDELGEVGRQQELCKLRVADAQDLVELHAIQRDLQRLTQRQLELSDEQAEALHASSSNINNSQLQKKNSFDSLPTLQQNMTVKTENNLATFHNYCEKI